MVRTHGSHGKPFSHARFSDACTYSTHAPHIQRRSAHLQVAAAAQLDKGDDRGEGAAWMGRICGHGLDRATLVITGATEGYRNLWEPIGTGGGSGAGRNGGG